MLKSASDGEIIYMGFLMDVAAPIIVPSGPAPVLPPSRRRDLMHQMIWLVQRLHAKRIVHGDLKLENMLLDDQGNLRLCDFAEGRYVDEDEHVWEGMSTWHYESPIWPSSFFRQSQSSMQPFRTSRRLRFLGLGSVSGCR